MDPATPTPADAPEPHLLQRFLDAQEGVYDDALAEVCAGRKRTHWMWFIFPQLDGLGSSPTARHYAIKSRREAEDFLRHPTLGPRLVASAQAAAEVSNKSAHEVFGSPDDLKLHSSATLFAAISPAGSVFHRLLDRYFDGRADPRTLDLLARLSG